MKNLKNIGLATLIGISSIASIPSNNQHPIMDRLKFEYSTIKESEIEEASRKFLNQGQINFYWNSYEQSLSLFDFPFSDWEIKVYDKDKFKENKNIRVFAPNEFGEELKQIYQSAISNEKKLKFNWIEDNRLRVENCPTYGWDIIFAYDTEKEEAEKIEFIFNQRLLEQFNEYYRKHSERPIKPFKSEQEKKL